MSPQCILETIPVTREGVSGLLTLEIADVRTSKKNGKAVHQVASALVTTPKCPFPLTPPAFENLCGKFTNAKWKQSLKLLANPTVSVGRLMEEKQWEGPTSHQAAVARDRLARDSYTMTETEAIDWARRAVQQQGGPAQDAVAQVLPRVGCYLALRASELILGPAGLMSGGASSGSGRGAAALPQAVGGRLVVVQLLEIKQGSATVVTLDKQTAHSVDLPQMDSMVGGMLAAPGAPYFVLTPSYEHRFTPGGSVAGGSSSHVMHVASTPYVSMARTSSLPLPSCMEKLSMPRNAAPQAVAQEQAGEGAAEENEGTVAAAAAAGIVAPPFGIPPAAPRRTSRGGRNRAGSTTHNHMPIKMEHQQLSMSLPTPSYMMQHHALNYHGDGEGASGMSGCEDVDGCGSPGHSKLKRLASVAAELCMFACGDGDEMDATADTSVLSAAGAGQVHVRKRRAQGNSQGTPPGGSTPELGPNTARGSPAGPFDAPNLPQLLRQLLIAPQSTPAQPAAAQGTATTAALYQANVNPTLASLVLSARPSVHMPDQHATPSPAQELPMQMAADRSGSAHMPGMQAMVAAAAAHHQAHMLSTPDDLDVRPMEYSRTGSPCHPDACTAPAPAVGTPPREEEPGVVGGEEEAWGGAVAAKLLPMIRQAAAQQVCVDHLARLLVERQARITALETALADRDRQVAELSASVHLQTPALAKGTPSPAVAMPGASVSYLTRKGRGALYRSSMDAGSRTQAGVEAEGEDAAALGNRTPSPPQPTLLMLAATSASSHQGTGERAIAPGSTVPEDDEDEVRPCQQGALLPSAKMEAVDAVMTGQEVVPNPVAALANSASVTGTAIQQSLATVAAAGAAASARCAALEGDLRDMQRELQAQRDLTGQLTALNAQLCERGQRLQLERNQALAALAAAAAQGSGMVVAA